MSTHSTSKKTNPTIVMILLFFKILEHTSEETLAEETNNLLAVRTKRTEKDKTNESAEEFLLTRKSVIHFV